MFARREMCLENARLLWRRYLPDGTEEKVLYNIEEKDALTSLASAIVSTATADSVVLAGRLPSNFAMHCEEGDWALRDSLGVAGILQGEVKRCVSKLQESCQAKRREVAEKVSEVLVLAVGLVADAVSSWSCGAGLIIDPRVDEMTLWWRVP